MGNSKISGLIVAVFILAGCSTMPPQNQLANTKPESVRVSGEVNETFIHRSGF